jgi:hypothetical protein
MVITPPKEHIQVFPTHATGPVVNNTVGLVGIQGAAIAGRQGIGVRTPNAAAVAAATIGLARLIHIPNMAIFNIGTKSVTQAAGMPPIKTPLVGKIVRGAGVAPNEH